MRRLDLSLAARLLVGISLLFGLLGCAVAWVLVDSFDELAQEQELARIHSLATMTAAASAPALDFQDRELLAERLALLQGSRGARFAVVHGPGGEELASWGTVPGPVDPSMPAVLASDHFEVAVPVHGRAGAEGTLLVGFGLEALEDQRAANQRRLGMVLAIGYLLSLVLSLALASWLARPLAKLTWMADDVRAGRLDLRELAAATDVSAYRRDEVMVLHHALATMARRLDEQMQALRDARASAEEVGEAAIAASQAKSRFLANMSHELRTPLNAIVGYADLLCEDLEDLEPEEIQGDLERIRQASSHLLSLISNILDLSKVEAGRMEVFCEPFALSVVVQEAVAAVRPMLVAQDTELRLQLVDELPPMHSDLTKLRQCLLNLLSNAAKFTESGVVVLRARPTRRGRVCIEVEDTGIGMSAEQVTRLFQEFGQADASTTRRYGGTGLGLALTKHLIELIGGTIAVRSTPGIGTCFTIDLPTEVSTTGVPKERLVRLPSRRTSILPDDSPASVRGEAADHVAIEQVVEDVDPQRPLRDGADQVVCTLLEPQPGPFGPAHEAAGRQVGGAGEHGEGRREVASEVEPQPSDQDGGLAGAVEAGAALVDPVELPGAGEGEAEVDRAAGAVEVVRGRIPASLQVGEGRVGVVHLGEHRVAGEQVATLPDLDALEHLLGGDGLAAPWRGAGECRLGGLGAGAEEREGQEVADHRHHPGSQPT